MRSDEIIEEQCRTKEGAAWQKGRGGGQNKAEESRADEREAEWNREEQRRTEESGEE